MLKQLELRVSKKDRAPFPEVPVFFFHLLYIYFDFTRGITDLLCCTMMVAHTSSTVSYPT